MNEARLKAKEVEFFAEQVDAAHARFMEAYFTGNRLGMKRFTDQHRLLYRRYHIASEEYAVLKPK